MEEERRNDVELKVIAERVSHFKEQLQRSDAIAEDWRERFCQKLDVVNLKIDALISKVDTLPCPSRIEHTKGIDAQIKALWVVTGGMVLAIIAEWVKGHGKL